jgi:hypothetical protein
VIGSVVLKDVPPLTDLVPYGEMTRRKILRASFFSIFIQIEECKDSPKLYQSGVAYRLEDKILALRRRHEVTEDEWVNLQEDWEL